jgi:hypothetical protein
MCVCVQDGPKVGIHYIVYKLLYTYFWPTGWDRNPKTLEPERPQQDRPAAYVIAQQYSPNFAALFFHLRKEKFGGR